jgi:uncharacterized membrane protein YjgN (DUF898 family)
MDRKVEPIAEPIEAESNEVDKRRLPLQFTGSTSTYFRIWIVNLLLTVLTLGIYLPWAKVRTRRYFYASTVLDGQSFDYLAKPVAILKGYLIILAALIALNLSDFISQFWGVYTAAIILFVLPLVIYKAHRFKAVNSAYRNVRFLFQGSVWGSYKAYGYFPILALLILTGGIAGAFFGYTPHEADMAVETDPILGLLPLGVFLLLILLVNPYLMYLQQRYFHGNIAFGKTNSRFNGMIRPYYVIYVYALFVAFLSSIVLLLLSIFTPALADLFHSLSSETFDAAIAEDYAGTVIGYAAVVIVFVVVEQYLYVKKMNYSWDNTQLGPIRFNLSLQAPDLIWIRLTNLIAIILSAGLLYPWAKVRRARYIMSRIMVSLPHDMDGFKAARVRDEDALGDTAADFFDWDIGW